MVIRMPAWMRSDGSNQVKSLGNCALGSTDCDTGSERPGFWIGGLRSR